MLEIPSPKINTVELSAALLRTTCALDLETLERSYHGLGNVQLEVFVGHAAHALVADLRTYLLQKEFTVNEPEIVYPTTAWDAVKNALPSWIKRHLKINFTRHQVGKHYKICPHMPVPEEHYSHCCLSWISDGERP